MFLYVSFFNKYWEIMLDRIDMFLFFEGLQFIEKIDLKKKYSDNIK